MVLNFILLDKVVHALKYGCFFQVAEIYFALILFSSWGFDSSNFVFSTVQRFLVSGNNPKTYVIDQAAVYTAYTITLVIVKEE